MDIFLNPIVLEWTAKGLFLVMLFVLGKDLAGGKK